MNVFNPNCRLWWRADLAGLCLALLLFTGCKGVPTPGERQARQQSQTVTAMYRPQGRRPVLPVLSTNASLGDYLQFAMLNQPRAEAAYYEWLAAVERITQARSFPDPQLTFQMDIQNIVTSIMPGIMGTIPWPDKLRVGVQIASAESQAKYVAFQTTVLENAFAVKRAYYQLYFVEEKIRVNQDTLSLLGDLENLARAQNAVGKVTLQDVLRAQIEQDRLNTEIANLEDSRHSLLAQFNAALGLLPSAPSPPLPKRFESTPLDLTSEQVVQTALSRNLRLQGLEAEVRVAEALISQARKSRVPDFSLGLMADAQMDPTLYRPLGTVTLPIWRDKIAAQIAEARANQRATQARLSAEQIALAVDFAERTLVYREATRNLALLHDQLLPKARQSLEVARIGYLTSRLDFFNLSDAERTLLGFQLDEIEANAQRELVLAELSLIIQGMPAASGSMGSRTAGMSRPSAPKKSNGGM